MDCCGHGHALTYRPLIWRKALTSVSAMLAGDVGPRGSTAAAQTAETASAALDVLRKSISVDVHSHGGKTGITSKAPPSDDLANAMRAGSLSERGGNRHARPTTTAPRSDSTNPAHYSSAGVAAGQQPRAGIGDQRRSAPADKA